MRAKTLGQIAYEADLRARPTYDSGAPRRMWHQLSDDIKATWERNPFPRWAEVAPSYEIPA